MSKLFDLNIEKILEDWNISDAIREIIANALDEFKITQTKKIVVDYKNKKIIIKDFGRGLQYKHFTQNENKEKNKKTGVIGKFGVGLKDAIATLNRNKIDAKIISSYGIFSVVKSQKEGFDLETIHMKIKSNPKKFIGTEFIITGASKSDLEIAKLNFLHFNDDKIIEENKFGQIIKTKENINKIYCNGLWIATEENFAFSYNILNPTKKMLESLNRERKNVGRNSYTDIIKNILKNSNSHIVINTFIQNLSTENYFDELNWKDTKLHFIKYKNLDENVVFVSKNDITQNPNFVDHLKSLKKDVIIISENLKQDLNNTIDINGEEINTTKNFIDKINKYNYKKINLSALNPSEKLIFSKTKHIINYIHHFYKNKKSKIKVNQIFLVNKIESIFESFDSKLVGLYDKNEILIARSQLKNSKLFYGTLIHELIHYYSEYDDVNLNFEIELTKFIGIFSSKII